MLEIKFFAYKTLCPPSTQHATPFRASITEITLNNPKNCCSLYIFSSYFSFLLLLLILTPSRREKSIEFAAQKFLFRQTFGKKKKKGRNSPFELLQTTLRERFRQPGWFLVVFSFATEFRASRFPGFLVLSIHHETASYLFLVRASRTLVIQLGESLNHTGRSKPQEAAIPHYSWYILKFLLRTYICIRSMYILRTVDKVETVVSSCPSSCLETNLANNVLVEIVPSIVNTIILNKVEEEKGRVKLREKKRWKHELNW